MFGLKAELMFPATQAGGYELGDSVLCGHSQSENSNVCGTRGGVAGPILLTKSLFKPATALFLSLAQHPDQPA